MSFITRRFAKLKFRTILIIGLAIRLAIAPFFAHPFDVFSWYSAGYSVIDGQRPVSSFLTPYQYSYFLFVFPATYIFNFLSNYLPNFTIHASQLNPALVPSNPTSITLVPGILFDLLVKLPLIVSDTIIAILIQRILRIYADYQKAIAASAFWFLNPVSIWISSGWGMFDTLPALFTILSLYLIITRKFTLSFLSLVIGVAMKYYAILLFFPLFLMVARLKSKSKALQSLLYSAILGLVLFFPLLDRVAFGFTSLVTSSSQSGYYYSGLSYVTAFTLTIPNLRVGSISGIIVGSLTIFSYVWTLLHKSSYERLNEILIPFTLPLLFLLSSYYFVGENFFVWVFPFCSILSIWNSRFRNLYLLESFVVFVSSITNSLLPYYLLPVSPWFGSTLVRMLSYVSPYRVAPVGQVVNGFSLGKMFLSGIGITSSFLLILMAIILIMSQRNGKRRV